MTGKVTFKVDVRLYMYLIVCKKNPCFLWENIYRYLNRFLDVQSNL
jgi:hypothetical protein